MIIRIVWLGCHAQLGLSAAKRTSIKGLRVLGRNEGLKRFKSSSASLTCRGEAQKWLLPRYDKFGPRINHASMLAHDVAASYLEVFFSDLYRLTRRL